MAHMNASAFGMGTGTGNEEFPILCETCLGENPFIRMTKQPFGKACKICDRPFTVYRWKPGPKARYKKTELCHTCAKIKNVCQTCVLDLQYGLPVQVRDSTLDEYEKMTLPDSDVGREYAIEQHEARMSSVSLGATYGKVDKAAASSAMLSKLTHSTPYYKRNLPHLCSFYAKGSCNRGSLCPYRHDMPVGGPLANQNIKDRYFGKNDPVALKILDRHDKQLANAAPLVPPDDPTITTLWLGGLTEDIGEPEVGAAFFPFGEVSSVRVISEKKCCFVTFQARESAEKAAAKLYNSLNINGKALRMSWGKRQTGSAIPAILPPGIKGAVAAAEPPTLQPQLYPSQNPANMAARFTPVD
jgi:pre-mRNA-splicing factor RBM22/SLT11